MTTYHLAQINIATMLAPIDSEIMSGFVARLDEINALAEKSAGFVWRLQTEEGDATAIRVFNNEAIIVNMSVWESVDALHKFTYASDHVEVFRKRRDWFEKMSKPMMALWWIPEGMIPTSEDGKAKLAYIEQHGVTPLAFTFKEQFSVEEMLTAQSQLTK